MSEFRVWQLGCQCAWRSLSSCAAQAMSSLKPAQLLAACLSARAVSSSVNVIKTCTHTLYRYSNQLDSLFFVGRVVGAGSFGVVRECVEISTGKRYAIKTIPKKPKRGPCEQDELYFRAYRAPAFELHITVFYGCFLFLVAGAGSRLGPFAPCW